MPTSETTGTDRRAEPPTKYARPLRLFVGLKIVPEVAEKLAELAQPLARDGARLVPSGDIHLTLVPPWNETHITCAVETLRSAISGFEYFLLAFEHLRYGPTLRRPHLLWAECVANNELAELHEALSAAYGQVDPRPFRPHVTLARLPQKGRTIVQKNPMDQSLSFTHYVTSVELFQSPQKGQSGYQILASLPLQAKVIGNASNPKENQVDMCQRTIDRTRF